MTTTRTPLGALGRGLLAGAIGTAVMTGFQLAAAKVRGEESAEPETPEAPRWEDAPAPAQVARRVVEGVFKRKLSADRIGVVTNVMHWAYGTALGGVYGLVRASVDAGPVTLGPAFGGGVWAASYAQLVPMGIYEPPWEYPAGELAWDVSYHLVYGSAVAAAYERIGA